MKLKFTPLAKSDLYKIQNFIGNELSNPIASKRIINNIVMKCYGLLDYPQLGMKLSAKTGKSSDLLYLVCGKYLIFYRFDDEYVSIIRILDSHTNYVQTILEIN